MKNEVWTYQELLNAYKQIIVENEQLRNENKILRRLHTDKFPIDSNEDEVATSLSEPTDSSYVPILSLNEKVTLFRNLFRGREDVYARRWYSRTSGKSGYQPVCLNEWNPQLCNKKRFKCTECPNRQFKAITHDDLYRHLEGKSEDGCDVMGLYVMLTDNTCHFLCVDFDDKMCEHGYQNDVCSFVKVCKEWKIPYSLERSRSGNGAHVWIFFEEPLPATKVRKLGNTLLTEAMNRDRRISFKSYDRLFPSQDRLPEGGFGNLIALPLQGRARKEGNSVFVDDSFEPFEDQWAHLMGVKKVAEKLVDELLSFHVMPSEFGELSTTKEMEPWEAPSPDKIVSEDFPKSIKLVRSNAIYIPLSGLSGKAINYIKRIAAFSNPEFYARQGMRLSTYNIPRIISCADISEEYIALPRGCEEAVLNTLSEKHISYQIEDKTNKGTSIPVQFKGELRKEQTSAIESLVQHRTGILNATTAFGKTVTAIGLISNLKQNTLILVHTKALLDQWKLRLEEFLDIDFTEEEQPRKRGRKRAFSPFGTLDSTGNSIHGMVDIALMQSCFDKEEVKLFVRDYGVVIVDECHHVSAVNFERIMSYTNARYVYGLTATPIRKDGHQPIIFMQCGSIRYSADAKMQMESQCFERLLIPRFTSYRELLDEKKNYSQIIQRMAEDSCRNQLIVDDVCKALAENRSPIVLTNLTSHVTVLANMIGKHCKNVLTLIGAESAKEKRTKMERLKNIPHNEPLVIVATGKYVGEGFDCPRLDTLFLTLPVSWKGIIAQYAGRLHREYPNKKEVCIYDYIDIHIPMCDVMYKRRLKGYALVGYKVQTRAENELWDNSQNVIFNGKNYQKALLLDLSRATKSIVISASKLWLTKRSLILDMLAEVMARGIEVVVIVRQDSEFDVRLTSMGVNVMEKDGLSLQTTIVDKSIVWYGSVNCLGYNTEEDNIVRIVDESIAEEIIGVLYE